MWSQTPGQVALLQHTFWILVMYLHSKEFSSWRRLLWGTQQQLRIPNYPLSPIKKWNSCAAATAPGSPLAVDFLPVSSSGFLLT